MRNHEIDLWEEIEQPTTPGVLKLRRADPEHPHDFFRGKDSLGNYFFQYTGEFVHDTSHPLPKFSGIHVSVEKIGERLSQLTIHLNDTSQNDIFRALCANLMSASAEIPEKKHQLVVEVIINHLERWHNLLRRTRDKLLSKSEQIGLMGELLILKDKFIPKLNAVDAISSWRGPSDDEQDYLYGNWLIEVKTQMSSSDRKLIISSKDQLDTTSGDIIVCHQTLGQSSENSPDSFTLTGLVKQIDQILSDLDLFALDLFHANLINVGYIERDEYDREYLLLNTRTFFEVGEGFPRIVASDLAEGIDNVHYSISINSCSSFEISEMAFNERLFKNDE